MTKSNINTLENSKSKNLIKTLLVFLCYFLYTNVVLGVLSTIGVTDSTIISFVADIIFLIGIVYAYKEDLKKDLSDLQTNYKILKIIKSVLFWIIMIILLNGFMGMITDIFYPNAMLDENTDAIFSISKISTIYTIFKTMIFAIVAEELLYRESLSDIIENDSLFIIISAIIYTLMNFMFTGFSSKIIVMDILSYFLPALIFSYAYVKNNRNIFILMLIKFVYQLIPLTILLLGL